jgi:hypothetical protein
MMNEQREIQKQTLESTTVVLAPSRMRAEVISSRDKED